YLPMAQPVQVRLQLSAAGGNSAEGRAVLKDGRHLKAVMGSGKLAMDDHFLLNLTLKVDLPGPLGQAGIKYEGPIMNAPHIELAFKGETKFDPFTTTSDVEVHATQPSMEIATIPL